MKHPFDQCTSDFQCRACRQYVSTHPALSGVYNRNHCPYCLHSRHLDLHRAGDRLCACKALMQPVGLSLKRTQKKYGPAQGELMLVHRCVDCGAISCNRIAADDDAGRLLEVFEAIQTLDAAAQAQIMRSGITLLGKEDASLVQARLFGWAAADRATSGGAYDRVL